ncbi:MULTISPECIES: HEPN/Toprim-associated domain-containing protein [unclassified Thalassospira]|uniref:HEPN/Toprim-associated domain-containing protein n=1 Tax=unclassified Thalassospira TaxID=2648997 RepID=UPI0007A635E5|nr:MULTISPECIES: HEPN/Toprim-associated domain-containing protein [unclassified Thalassospira]KZC99106.1 hypothetical protein AUQ41_11315 [Thalassospira sp. MCCC 1A02898]ONH89348.1 hypothetical protein TH47_01275 [Thalassospira sp. MCCC 1A02803]
MSEEHDIYFDNEYQSDVSYMWAAACALLFANDDFYRRRIKDAHPIVRKTVLGWYDDENQEIAYLLAPAEKARSRMHIQGYTADRCKALWEHGFPKHIATLKNMRDHHGIDLEETISSQEDLTFEQWLRRVNDMELSKLLRFPGTEFELTDPFASMAVEIDVLKPKEVWIELGSYIDELDPKYTLHENLRKLETFQDPDQEFIQPTGTILILTEGKSDTRILSTAILKMYPEYSDLYQFIDFEEFSISGGASMLTRMVKTFASVRMDQPVLALFDNDAAGLAEKHHLDSIGTLPSNIKTMALPEIELAKSYPTIGPEGNRHMDVNGTASSIELFLGKEALTDKSGELHPIRWTEWNKQIKRYQGSLEYKDAVTTRFLYRMNSCGEPPQLRAEFPELDQLLNCIFHAFH